MRDGLKKLGLYQQVDRRAWQESWSVHSKSVGYGQQAFEYMADYLFRAQKAPGIANQRIIKCEDGKVSFWYKESKTKRRIVCEVTVDEFTGRFLKHVLPKGFVKVRYFGFYALGARAKAGVGSRVVGGLMTR